VGADLIAGSLIKESGRNPGPHRRLTGRPQDELRGAGLLSPHRPGHSAGRGGTGF